MWTDLGLITSAPTGILVPASHSMAARDPLNGIIFKEPSVSQKADSSVIPEGKGKARMIETENQSPVSSPDHPSYKADNNAGTSSLCDSINVDISISTGLISSDSPTIFTLALTPTDTVTPKDQQPKVQGLYDKVVVHTDLHKLADAALNESATILFEEHGESVSKPQDPDNDTMVGHIKWMIFVVSYQIRLAQQNHPLLLPLYISLLIRT